MLKNKCNTTIACDATESRQKIIKITGIVMSQFTDILRDALSRTMENLSKNRNTTHSVLLK